MKKVRFTFDPLLYYRGKMLEGMWDIQLAEAMGILPLWAITGASDESVIQTFERCYKFGLMNICPPGSPKYINDKGIFQYPEDPPMYPLASLEVGDEMVYFYRSALVGVIKDNGEQFITRMD